jgi:hypothetical protein
MTKFIFLNFRFNKIYEHRAEFRHLYYIFDKDNDVDFVNLYFFGDSYGAYKTSYVMDIPVDKVTSKLSYKLQSLYWEKIDNDNLNPKIKHKLEYCNEHPRNLILRRLDIDSSIVIISKVFEYEEVLKFIDIRRKEEEAIVRTTRHSELIDISNLLSLHELTQLYLEN